MSSKIDFKEVYNCNPKGLKEGDCAVRAIAYASGQEWEKVFNDLTQIAIKKKRMPNSKQVYEEYLEDLGFTKHNQPKWDDGTKYTVYEAYIVIDSINYDVVISVANHLTCIDNNNLIDTWNCRNKCIGNYWTRPKRPNTIRPQNKAKKR